MQFLLLELETHCIEQKLTAYWLFIMKNIGFSQKNKSNKILTVLGFRNVWSKIVEVSFHMTMTTECSADGLLFILY